MVPMYDDIAKDARLSRKRREQAAFVEICLTD